MRVRLLRITGVDLNIFEFDWDLTWACLFLTPEGRVFARYGGRDGTGADSRNTLEGLNYAMQGALETYRTLGKREAPPARKALRIEDVPSAKAYSRGGCIHCHMVKEIIRAQEKSDGTFQRDSLWTYPLPENIGVTLHKQQGNIVDKVSPSSPAAGLGIEPGDAIEALGGLRVRSFADAQYALHKAPLKGEIAVTWARGGKINEGKIALTDGWKKTNPTWRPSMLDLLPSLTVYGTDLTGDEKAKIGLAPTRLAFRQTDPVHTEARAMGVQAGDVILGINNQKMEMTRDQFLAHVRRNYIVGDRLTLNLWREGAALDLPIKLK